MTLDEAIAELRRRNEPVPRPARLPTEDEVVDGGIKMSDSSSEPSTEWIIVRGIGRGRRIELEDPLDLPDGTIVDLQVRVIPASPPASENASKAADECTKDAKSKE